MCVASRKSRPHRLDCSLAIEKRSFVDTGKTNRKQRGAPALVAAIVALSLSLSVAADTLTVKVLDRDGVPVPDVVVYVDGATTAGQGANERAMATMDQVNKRFVPHVLVVQAGTPVDFPNSDPIAHHVYSFSHPNHFKLPMYKGRAHPPVEFAESGIVVLGCNIHDHMLGYIVVVDTPVFGKTDTAGTVQLAGLQLEPGNVRIWSPRLRDDADELTAEITGAAQEPVVTFRLVKALHPPHDENTSEALSWTDY
jgi:plastocyanin